MPKTGAGAGANEAFRPQIGVIFLAKQFLGSGKPRLYLPSDSLDTGRHNYTLRRGVFSA